MLQLLRRRTLHQRLQKAEEPMLNGKPSNELGWNALALTKWLGLGLARRMMVVVVKQDALGL